MKQHEYKITIEHIKDAKGQPSTYAEAVQFKAFNHDDIFKIIDRVQQSNLVDDESAKAFAVGMKLMGEVLLENKDVPIFKAFLPEFIQLVKSLKKNALTQS